MSEEVEKEALKTAPMYKGKQVMEVTLDPNGRSILEKEGWSDKKSK